MLRLILGTHPRLRQERETGSPSPGAQEEGAILLLVIWILALLSVVVLSWAQEWRTELRLSANFRDDRQCHSLAEAGVYYAITKLTAAKIAEIQPLSLGSMEPAAPNPWNGDQRRHLLELSGGKVEVRVADEGGKINLNQADELVLRNLLGILGFPAEKVPVMVDSILDWRSSEARPRAFGAKSPYYLNLDPPYPAKEGLFDTVEELSWVRGFAGIDLSRLYPYLTVQGQSRQINLNTASNEAMLALGLPPDLVSALVQEREFAPLRSQEVMPRLSMDPQLQQMLPYINFRSSTFFSVLATGMVNNTEGARHTIKAVVQVDSQGVVPRKFLYWADDYPG
ncbi:MAG: type II secretion system minor pseudopilin [Desulfobaccales bacterium]